jgi:hypothetical protein
MRNLKASFLLGFAVFFVFALPAKSQVVECPSPTPIPKQDGQSEPIQPERISPAVGTGGTVGGPTGFFTLYNTRTLPKKAFTFSAAYSNFDRDPGNVDLTEVPLSFQYGVSNRMELFFNTTGWRGINVNAPQNLSSFYLPNSQLHCGGPGVLCSGPAIILAPSGPNVGTLAGTAIFRPLNNQPFVSFPFVGGSAGTFGLGPGQVGSLFGFPGFNALLGPPVATSNGNFGSADTFPGIGSPVGGILPGVVLATQVLPATPLTLPITVPATFTIAPSYLPDAPFVNRLYGSSSFETFTVGLKYRFLQNKISTVAVIPFYRFYRSRANSPEGFDHLQEGASPGANVGDFGAFVVAETSLKKKVNISFNSGFTFNSNPKGNFGGASFSMLDRPNEVFYGLGIDFPIDTHFQPIFEVRSVRYAGGQTPNAFQNNPVDVVGGLKWYSKRYDSGLEFGFGGAYRRHLNQQDLSHFNLTDFNTQVNRVTNVVVPGRGLVTVTGTTVPATSSGFPRGFVPSDDPNGFMVQFWIGRRPKPVPFDQKPSIDPGGNIGKDQASEPLTLSCPTTRLRLRDGAGCPVTRTVRLKGTLKDRSEDLPMIGYLPVWITDPNDGTSITPQGGEVSGEYHATWQFPETVSQRAYTIRLQFKDCKTGVLLEKPKIPGPYEVVYTLTPDACPNCKTCPAIQELKVECPDPSVKKAASDSGQVKVRSSIAIDQDPAYASDVTTRYEWTVSAGTIVGDSSSSEITIDHTGVGSDIDVKVTAIVSAPGCPTERREASCAVHITVQPECSVFDAYRDIRFNDEKARLDNFAIWLLSEPSWIGYYVSYSGSSCDADLFTDRKRDIRANRSRNYLTHTRQLDGARLQNLTVGGTKSDSYAVILWVCPANLPPPVDRSEQRVGPTLEKADCPAKKKKSKKR